MSKISLVKSNQSYQGSLKVLNPLKHNLKKQLKNLTQIVIKINFVTTRKELATTPFDTVKAFIDFVKPFYNGKIIIAEEASTGSTKKGFKKYGFLKLAKINPQVEVLDSAEDEVKEIKINYPNGQVILPISKIFLNSPFTVSITRAKTHDEVVVTLGIKNLLVGAIQGGIPVRVRIHQGKDIHWILTEMAKKLYPDLVIIDGVVGMQGNGPDKGFPKKSGWLVASQDPLAADSLATYLMGFDISDVGYLCLLKKANLGKLYPKDKITIIGKEPRTLITPFKPHHTFASQCLWRS